MRTSPGETVTALTVTEAALLGLLAPGPRSGYDVHRTARAGVGYVWAPAKSRIYAVLPRLVAAGLAEVEAVTQDTRPDKQVYALTPAGDQAFQLWLEQPSWRSHDELLLKVFFGRRLSPDRLRSLVERYRDAERARLEEYREIEGRIAGEPGSRFGYLTLRWGLGAVEARLRWADETLRTLEGPA